MSVDTFLRVKPALRRSCYHQLLRLAGMYSCTRGAVRKLFGVVVMCLPGIASGQATPYFDVLRRPPRAVGSCVPLPQRGRADSLGRRTSRLVIKSLPPGRSREMEVSVDQRGRPISYSDRAVAMTAARAGVGTSVFVILDSLGVVRLGSWTQSTITYPDSLWSSRDLSSLNAMLSRANVRQSSRSLTLQEQDSIRSLVKFLRQRCPA